MMKTRNVPGVFGLPTLLVLGLLLVIPTVQAQVEEQVYYKHIEIEGNSPTEHGHDPTYGGDKLTDFNVFVEKFYKKYTNSEHWKRKKIFDENVKVITEHNKLYKSGQSSYFQRVNEFTDITAEEFGDNYLGGGQFQSLAKAEPLPCEKKKTYVAPSSYGTHTASYSYSLNPAPIGYAEPTASHCISYGGYGSGIQSYRCKRQADVDPITYIDWFERGAIRKVGEAQACNSCAAHATLTLIDHCMWNINRKLPEPLSVQQLLACTHNGSTLGKYPLRHNNIYCISGFPDIHLDYLRKLWMDSNGTKNILLERDTRGSTGEDCPPGDSDPTKVNVKVTGFNYQLFTTEADMFKALQSGPMEARINFRVGLTRTKGMQSYGGGVFYDPTICGDYATETVPEDCYKDGEPGTYDCVIFKCLQDMPLHCNRYLKQSPPDVGIHSVVVVGAGKDERNVNYWTIKNSWGKSWGENGFIRMRRGRGHCGVGSSYTQAQCDVI